MDLKKTIRLADKASKHLKNLSRAPNLKKTLARRWNRKEAAVMVGRSENTLKTREQQLINDGLLSPFDSSSGVIKFELKHIRELQSIFSTQPWRHPDIDEARILSIQTSKGGAAKTTMTVTVAQYLASKGYRVLLIDMDSQASATTMLGLNDEYNDEISDQYTVMPYIHSEKQSLHYAIQPTYWPGLDIIQNNLSTYAMEWEIATSMIKQNVSGGGDTSAYIKKLKRGIDTVKDNYDVVLIDSPPSLGTITMNIIYAADALIVPTPAKPLDFESSRQYLHLIDDILERVDHTKEFKFIKIIPTLYSGRTTSDGKSNYQADFRDILRRVFGGDMMLTTFNRVQEIENRSMSLSTILDAKRPPKKHMEHITAMCEEIETEIISTWPSKAQEAFERKTEQQKLEGVDE